MPDPFYKQEWFLFLFSSIIGGVGYVLKGYWDSRKNKKVAKKEGVMIDGLRSVATVYSCMENIHKLESVGRVFMLEVSNSGEVPKPGSQIYARAIEIKVDEGREEQREWYLSTYGELEVDEDYIRMVLQAQATQQAYKFKVDQSHANCILKDIYLELGVKYSEIYHIYSDVNKWKQYIISIATFEDDQYFDSQEIRAMINNNVQQIRYNFKKYR